MEEDLEERSEKVSNIKNPLLDKLSIITHFGGESVLGIAIIYYLINNWNEHNFNGLLTCFGIGILAEPISQPLAFYLKGRSLTKEGNYQLARKFANLHKENKRKGGIYAIPSWLDKKICQMHLYFSRTKAD